MKRKLLSAAIPSALALAFGSTAVYAEVLLEEIVITAQKREQNLQDVSVAVTALSGDQISALGLQSQTQLIAQSPGVALNDNGATNIIRIRGMGADTFSDALESSAAVYRDEVYRPTLASNNAQMFDVERVEILRGPQGTLYGRNTNAGLIHVYSRRPTEELEGYGEVQVGNFGQTIFEGAISGTVTDAARARLAVKYNKDDGYQKNQGSGGGDDFGATDVTAVRAQIEFDLGDAAQLLLAASHAEERSTNIIYSGRGHVEADGFTPCSASDVKSNRCFSVSPTGLFQFSKDDAGVGYSERSDLAKDLDATDFAATLTWDINDSITLTSISAYEEISRYLEEDSDMTDFGLFDGFGGFINGFISYEIEAETISQEIRLNGEADQLKWVAGVYYFNDDKGQVDSLAPGFGLDTLASLETESTAVFGQVDYSISDTVTLIGGLRYTDDERETDVAAPLAGFFGGSTSESYKVGTSEWTYKVGVDWVPSEDLLLYASYTTGVKSPEFSLTLTGMDAAGAAPVGEEKVGSFELGSKWTFLDGRARLNTSMFLTETKDYQGTAYEGIATRFLNIGDTTVYGAEIELQAAPTANLDVMLGVSWLETEIDTDPSVIVFSGPADPGTGFANGTAYPLDGNELVFAPNYAVNGVVRYTIPTDRMGEFAVQVDFSWQDDVFQDTSNNRFDVQDDYALVNLRAFWESEDEKYHAQVFIENLEDEFYTNELASIEFFDRQFVLPGKPRTYGAKFGVRF